jgi:hypothetical protein
MNPNNCTLSDDEFSALMVKLREPFDVAELDFRPMIVAKDKKRAQAAVYADPRTYMARLDEVYPAWECTYSTWGDRIICHLTIAGVTRSSTGEMDKQSENQEIGGTAAEAQAFKRACTQFGTGRYLYEIKGLWAEYDEVKRAFTDSGLAELRRRMVEITKALLGEPVTPKRAPGKGPRTSSATQETQKAPPPVEETKARADGTFQLTPDQAKQFQVGVQAVCGDKSKTLLTEACKTLGFAKFSEVNQEQWDILCFWLEQMEEEEKPFRLTDNAIAYAKTELAKRRGELVE